MITILNHNEHQMFAEHLLCERRGQPGGKKQGSCPQKSLLSSDAVTSQQESQPFLTGIL